MFEWLKTHEPQAEDPKVVLSAISAAKNGRCEKAMGKFRACDRVARATIVQEVAYLPVNEGIAKLIAYAMTQDPDNYVRSVARRVADARIPLRMQALQYISN